MTRLLLTLSLLLLSAQVPVLSQNDWFGDLQRFGIPISAGAPQGYQVARRPGGPVDPARTESAPAEITVVGFVERGGTRYYLTEEGSDQWIDNGNPSYWLVIPGAVFPEKPPLSSRQKGIDPDSGENVTIEVYEETVALVQTTAWPMAQPEYPDVVLPVKVKSIEPTTGDAWRATFTVYPSFDSNIDKYAFPYPSSNQMSDPAFQVLRKLVSKPSFKEITVTGTARAEQMMTVLKPGIVFNGLFAGGKLYYLEAGDTWPPIVPASRLSAPQFQSLIGLKAFRFHITTIDGGHTLIEVMPDKITGADYTQYAPIAKMGPPFDDQTGLPKWLMEEWGIEIHCDQTVHVVAPLMEGRGAPGMLELESLSLDDSEYDREVAALKTFFEVQPPPLAPAGGWISILEKPLGAVAKQQQIPESAPW